jgi:hypothetical protein
VVPPKQHDPVAAARLVDLLLRHGVEVTQASTPVEVGYATYPAGTTVISASQPYRPFLLTMLRHQRYPEVRNATDGGILEPYDVASWSLPLAMGVEVVECDQPVEADLEPVTSTTWPQPTVDPSAAGHLIPAAADSVYPAVNQLLEKGIPVHRLAADAGPGRRGDVYLDADDISAGDLRKLAEKLFVPVTPVAEAPQTSLLEVGRQRVGLFKPWVASMDEGWTRFALERYEFPLVSLTNEKMRSGEFTDQVDVVLFPDVSPAIIKNGEPAKGSRYRRWWTPLPPGFAGGIDTLASGSGEQSKKKKDTGTRVTGSARLKAWVESGGTVVALDSSSQYLIELFELPVTNVLGKVSRDDFNCPGSMLSVEMNQSSPLSFGMRPQEAIYFAGSPAFQTRVPDPRFERTVVARYPADDKDILISGYLEGGEKLEKKAAVVEFEVGKGTVTLIGFRAQHRAQPLRTFKLLFNSLYDVK